ncbi:MAG: S8 family serine peptidase [Candidatus Hodarchaeota archaeon]
MSFVDWDPIYNDLHGEGTCLAGIVGGTGDASNGTYEGIAPGAQLINAKCVDLLGITLWHWAVSAIEYSFDHGADIILVGWNIIGYPGDPLTTAINEIVKKGITVVTASGSLGPSYMTINTPGMASNAITVGLANETVNGSIIPVNISSRGFSTELVSKPDLLAPGVNITSCLPVLDIGGYEIEIPINYTPSYGVPLVSNSNYTSIDSPAASAAYVAGCVALLLQDLKFARPETIKDALLRAAGDLGYDTNIQGSGIIDLNSSYQYLIEHQSPMPHKRTFSPALAYAGFVPNFRIGILENVTSVWFASSYGSINFLAHLIQNLTLTSDRNYTHLLQGMFGLYFDDQFNFLMMDKVYREMHLTHYGTFSRAVSILNHQDKLLIIITVEAWSDSMESMRLTFDFINIGDETINNLRMHTWWKADLDLVLSDIEGMAKDDTGGYLAPEDTLYVNDTTRPGNETFFALKSSNPSYARAVGGLSDTISWVQDNSTALNATPGGDGVDNVTIAAKYNVSSSLDPNQTARIRYSVACGLDFNNTVNAANFTLNGYLQPEIRDIAIVKMWLDRMYQVGTPIHSSSYVINTGNVPIEDTMVVFGTKRQVNGSTESHILSWYLGSVAPLELMKFDATWVPTYESRYSCYWIAADEDTVQNILFNIDDLASWDWESINFTNIDLTDINWTALLTMNGSLGSIIGGIGADDNPIDNTFVRDIFIYEPHRMYIHSNVLPEDQDKPIPRMYAGFTPFDPISAPMKPEFIGDYAMMNLTLFTSVPITGLNWTITGNASVSIFENLDDLAAVLGGGFGESQIIGVMDQENLRIIEGQDANITFWINGSEHGNVTSWKLFLDGAEIDNATLNESYVEFSFSTGNLTIGNYNLTAIGWLNGTNTTSQEVKIEVHDGIEETGYVLALFIDATLLKFPMEGTYESTIVFTSDQGYIDTIDINYTIQHPKGKILFDVSTSHNDILDIIHGDQRDMMMASYYQLYEQLKSIGYDMDEYIVFEDFTQMELGGINLITFYDAIVLPDPEKYYTQEEIDILVDYYNNGGKIIVMAEPDGGNSSSTANLLGGDGMSMDFDFDFDFESIQDLISGAPIAPDTCNLSTLSNFVSLFGFEFNESSTSNAIITNITTSHAITSNFSSASLEMDSYTAFNIVDHHAQNTILAANENGTAVAAIHENDTSGGIVVLIGDSNMFDAYNINNGNNSDFISEVMAYCLRNELNLSITQSSSEVRMGKVFYIELQANSTLPGVNYNELFGILAFKHVGSDEMVLMQFFSTSENNYVTALPTGGLKDDFGNELLPPVEHTGEWKAIILFQHPNVTGVYAEVSFTILPAISEELIEFEKPVLEVLLQGVLVMSVSIGIILLVYFNARRKQEESMSIPELDRKMKRDIDNVIMELQNKITLLSEEILFKKQEDPTTRIKNLEEKLELFNKTVQKLKKYKKKMSKF